MTSIIVINILISVLATISVAAHKEADALLLAAHSTLKKASMGVSMLTVKPTLGSAFGNVSLSEDYSEWLTIYGYGPDCSGQKVSQTNVALGYCVPDNKGSGLVYQVEDDQKHTLSVYFYDNPSCTGTPTNSGKKPLTGQCNPDELTSMEYSEGKPWESVFPSFTVMLSPDSCSLPAPMTYSQAFDVCVAASIYKSCSNGVGDLYQYDNDDCSGSYTEVNADASKCITSEDGTHVTSICSPGSFQASSSSKATLTYYADAECTEQGGGPPGLVSNPVSAPIGECVTLLTNGYGIEAVSCDNNGALTTTYPNGCDAAEGPKFQVPPGVCTTTNGIHAIVTC